MFGIERGTCVHPAITHSDGDKVAMLIRLKRYQIFGAIQHTNEETGVYVIQAIKNHQGSVFGPKPSKRQQDIARDVRVRTNEFHDLLFGRGVPQTSLTHTSFSLIYGISVTWNSRYIDVRFSILCVVH